MVNSLMEKNVGRALLHIETKKHLEVYGEMISLLTDMDNFIIVNLVENTLDKFKNQFLQEKESYFVITILTKATLKMDY